MKFNLKTPCSNCPFRTDCLNGWLGEQRATGIVSNLDAGGTHQCHKTGRNNAQHCAGALIMMQNAWGGFAGGAAVLACREGALDHKALDQQAPVFKATDDFIEHHRRKEENEP